MPVGPCLELFHGGIGETSERQRRAHMAFPDRYVTFPMYEVGAGSGVHWEVGG